MLVKDPTTGLMRIDKDFTPSAPRFFDTGKVKIGCAFVRGPRAMGSEEEVIQAILLGAPYRRFPSLRLPPAFFASLFVFVLFVFLTPAIAGLLSFF